MQFALTQMHWSLAQSTEFAELFSNTTPRKHQFSLYCFLTAHDSTNASRLGISTLPPFFSWLQLKHDLYFSQHCHFCSSYHHRRATKLIRGLRDLSYGERVEECGLTTLETRRIQKEVFRILNGHENLIKPNRFLSPRGP